MAKSSADAKELLKFIAGVCALATGDDAEDATTQFAFPPSRGEHAKFLQACADAYLQSHSFRAGDFVQVKPALAAAYIYPKAGYPAVVVEDIDPPLLRDDKESHYANYGMELDLRILVIADDGTPVTFAVPSQLFEPYVEQPGNSEQAQEGNHDQTSAG